MTEDVRAVRVARAEAIHVRIAFRRPLLDSTGEYTHRRTWLLRLVDDAGREGLGEAAVSPFAQDAVTDALARLMRETVARLAAGQTPQDAELLAGGEAGRAVLATIDAATRALAPSAGDATDGQAARSVPVSALIGFGGPDAGAEAAAQAIELGFGTLELRAGFERETDQLVDRVRAIRAAVGPEPRIRVDAGGAWDLDTAVERMHGIEPYGIEYVAQPLPAWDTTGHAALRERVDVPVALDESVESEGAARAALAEGAADVLIVRPARVGGQAAVSRIANAAERTAERTGAGGPAAAGVGLVVGRYVVTGVGIAASLRIAAALAAPRVAGQPRAGGRTDAPAHALATAGVLAHDLLRTPLTIDHGSMPVPAAVSLDEDEVGRLALERVAMEGKTR